MRANRDLYGSGVSNRYTGKVTVYDWKPSDKTQSADSSRRTRSEDPHALFVFRRQASEPEVDLREVLNATRPLGKNFLGSEHIESGFSSSNRKNFGAAIIAWATNTCPSEPIFVSRFLERIMMKEPQDNLVQFNVDYGKTRVAQLSLEQPLNKDGLPYQSHDGHQVFANKERIAKLAVDLFVGQHSITNIDTNEVHAPLTAEGLSTVLRNIREIVAGPVSEIDEPRMVTETSTSPELQASDKSEESLVVSGT